MIKVSLFIFAAFAIIQLILRRGFTVWNNRKNVLESFRKALLQIRGLPAFNFHRFNIDALLLMFLCRLHLPFRCHAVLYHNNAVVLTD